MLAALALGLAGCGTSPRIDGPAALAPSPAPTTQSAQQSAAVAALTTLKAAVTAAQANQKWTDAATAQLTALLARLNTPDPLSAGTQDGFKQPEPASGSLPEAADAASQALEKAARETDDGDLRLVYSSAATAAIGLRTVATAPADSGASPTHLQHVELASSLLVALGHAWALVYGLGVALGRLDSKDATHEYAAQRLAKARELRNELRDAIDGEPPVQPASFTLPTAMNTVGTIRAGLAQLELNLLDGYGRLVAADADKRWRARMREQVSPVQAVGGALPYWPGWKA